MSYPYEQQPDNRTPSPAAQEPGYSAQEPGYRALDPGYQSPVSGPTPQYDHGSYDQPSGQPYQQGAGQYDRTRPQSDQGQQWYPPQPVSDGRPLPAIPVTQPYPAAQPYPSTQTYPAAQAYPQVYRPAPLVQPMAYPMQPLYVQAMPRASSGMATASMILGICGLMLGVCTFGLCSLLAVIFGHVGLAQTKDGTKGGRGLAIAGLIMGYVALAPAVLFSLFFLGGLALL